MSLDLSSDILLLAYHIVIKGDFIRNAFKRLLCNLQ
jgi:hypothetical protein